MFVYCHVMLHKKKCSPLATGQKHRGWQISKLAGFIPSHPFQTDERVSNPVSLLPCTQKTGPRQLCWKALHVACEKRGFFLLLCSVLAEMGEKRVWAMGSDRGCSNSFPSLLRCRCPACKAACRTVSRPSPGWGPQKDSLAATLSSLPLPAVI